MCHCVAGLLACLTWQDDSAVMVGSWDGHVYSVRTGRLKAGWDVDPVSGSWERQGHGHEMRGGAWSDGLGLCRVEAGDLVGGGAIQGRGDRHA